MASPGLLTIPPEIFGHVAGQLPLYATAPTLRSLALSNRYLFDHVHPLLYRHLDLTFSRDVYRSLDVLLRLRDPDAGLGNEVRALYLSFDPHPTRSPAGGRRITSMTLLKDLISSGKLPFLKRLELFGGNGDGPEVPALSSAAGLEVQEIEAEPCVGKTKPVLKATISGVGSDTPYSTNKPVWVFPTWDLVKDGCPQLCALVVNFYNVSEQALCRSSFWKLESLSSLSLTYESREPSTLAGGRDLVGRLALIAGRLESLSLLIHGPIEPFLDLTFPSLQELSFHFQKTRGPDPTISMDFWQRHPFLESLFFANYQPDNREVRDSAVMSSYTPALDQLLPNLKQLSVSPDDLEYFSTLLQQLKTLLVLGDTDRPWFSPDTRLSLPHLRSFTVLVGKREDVAQIVNASPQLEELFWWGVFPRDEALEDFITFLIAPHSRLQRLFFDYPQIMPDEDYSPNSAMGHATLALVKWFPSLNVMGICVREAYKGDFYYAQIVRDPQGTVTYLKPIRTGKVKDVGGLARMLGLVEGKI
ncbi:hypothetical protein BKA70DRAFT_1574918 [Coprinopsis sp. MPI-PUGE-AT-0042]|nr:hypothetical protein BKA70DRAFT_1574918 [Coprinopsis sp. MPI-PUGE-AT-0042]